MLKHGDAKTVAYFLNTGYLGSDRKKGRYFNDRVVSDLALVEAGNRGQVQGV